jgi:hypothetical protein
LRVLLWSTGAEDGSGSEDEEGYEEEDGNEQGGRKRHKAEGGSEEGGDAELAAMLSRLEQRRRERAAGDHPLQERFRWAGSRGRAGRGGTCHVNSLNSQVHAQHSMVGLSRRLT